MSRGGAVATAAAATMLVLLAAAGEEGAATTLDVVDALLPPFIGQRLERLVRDVALRCPAAATPDDDDEWRVVWYRPKRGRGRLRGKVLPVEEAAARAGAGGAVAVYVGGWGNTPADDAAVAVARALLRGGVEHVLAIDTRRHFALDAGYEAAAAAVATVARGVEALVAALQRRGVHAARVHVVGFSLGAHAAAAAGQQLRRAGTPLGRVTALDAARPCFAASPHLDRSSPSARFVVAVHSSWGALGLSRRLGDADVYVPSAASCARLGRGARALYCTHVASWRVASQRRARAQRCTDARAARSLSCTAGAFVLPSGLLFAPESMRGVFLLELPSSSTLIETNSSLSTNKMRL